jgi:sn-glycerol 3-phosphate transport system ATP-binding protein
MDEPLSNLDAKLRASVRKDIKKLQVDLGITVVYVTHDQTEAMSMADQVVLMKDGRVLQTGAPEDLYYRPANTFVAEFVGAPPMALIDGTALSGFEGAARIGLRAENVSVAQAGQGRLTCRVTECEFLGSETFVGLSHPAASGLTVSMPGLKHIPSGEELDIAFNNEDLHFFASAGQRTSRPTGAFAS